MHKKGQITLFIIIGIVLIIGVGIILYLKATIGTQKLAAEAEVSSKIALGSQDIKTYVESCIALISEPLIFEIASKGGSFSPVSDIYFNDKKLNILANYQSGFGYKNSILMRESMENELSNEIKQELRNCINWSIFKKQGFNISEGGMIIETIIADKNINVFLEYPLILRKSNYVINLDKFSSNINLPLGKFYSTVIDIINSEATLGFFDKEQYMLEQGGKVAVEKHRPYPNTIHIIKQFDKKQNEDFIFQFAMKGVDTVGREVIMYEGWGCCINEGDGTCFKNVELSQCISPNSYNNSNDCVCYKNARPSVEGCCDKENNCELTTERECSSIQETFYKNDFRCSESNCQNLNCQNTYNYVTDDFSGPTKRHGESWCSYESMAGKGLDYVGTRHYLHSCINGVEYVEPCRDYREELCSEDIIIQSGKYYQKARCRINRWYDCAEQNNRTACEEETLRDCVWADYLWSQKKCHPEVSPGLKFWEIDSQKICNIASLNRSDYGEDYPRSWGQSALLYCQRTGDCGNYRNVADDLTILGYYNRDGTPEEWAYWDPGYTQRGNDFVIRVDIDKTNISRSASIPTGMSGGYARCNLWEAPNTNKCDLCNNSELRPCTKYKCRSLGKNCVFNEDNQSCISYGSPDTEGPEISLTGIQPGYSYVTQPSIYYPNGVEHIITPNITIHQPFNFSLSTSEPTRCIISLAPPNIDPNIAGVITEILLNEFDYKSSYNITIRFPSSNFTTLNSYLLFVRCNDNSGNQNDKEFIIEVTTEEVVNDTNAPEILKIEPEPINIVRDLNNNFNIFVNEPFDSCRYSTLYTNYTNMTNLNCSTEESDIIYDVNYPLGSYVCSASINVTTGTNELFFGCEDKKGNIGNATYRIS